MSAFYSGTDNNNDRMSINYSMVIGNLTPTTYSHVVRFNLYEHKISCTLEDVFDTQPQENFQVPKAWLDQIKKPAPPPAPAKVMGQGRAYSFGGGHKGKTSIRATPDSRPYGSSPKYMSNTENDFWDSLLRDSVYLSQFSSQEDELEEQYGSTFGGKEAVDAMEQISLYLEDLTDSDEGLLDVIRQAYAMLGEKGRNDLAMKGF